MNAYASTGPGFGRRLEDLMECAEAEFRQAVAYVDRVVVPEVRRETAGASRQMAGHLNRFADWLHPLQESDGKRGL